MPEKVDIRPQWYWLLSTEYTEVAPDGGIVVPVNTGFDRKARKGVLIHEYRVMVPNTEVFATMFAANDDAVRFGITQFYNAGAAPLVPGTPGCVEFQCFGRADFGAAATGLFVNHTLYQQRYDIPLLVHPASLYLFVRGLNSPVALSLDQGIRYEYVDLSDQDYRDMWEDVLSQDII